MDLLEEAAIAMPLQQPLCTGYVYLKLCYHVKKEEAPLRKARTIHSAN